MTSLIVGEKLHNDSGEQIL